MRSRWLSRSQHALVAALLQAMFEHIRAGRLEADTGRWASLWQAEAYALNDYQGCDWRTARDDRFCALCPAGGTVGMLMLKPCSQRSVRRARCPRSRRR